jgi:hypothetical protein
MKRTTVDDLHKKRMKNSKYRREYEALDEEFSLAGARSKLAHAQASRRSRWRSV